MKHKYLHKGQFGKHGGKCQDVAFSKMLHYQMSTYSRNPLGHFKSDTASYFDHIVMGFSLA